MMRWLRLWWKNISKTLRVVIIFSLAILIAFLVVNILGYIYLWDWTGLVPLVSPSHPQNTDFQPGKTLWDWYQLLIIPVVLVVGGFLLNFATSRTEREIAFGVWWLTRLQQKRDQLLADQRARREQKAAEKRAETEREISLDNQYEAALQGYIDNMSTLLLDQDLSNPVDLDKVRKIGRVRTLAVLRRCDGERKASVLQFLSESGLIDQYNKVIDLDGADFSRAELFRAQLSKVDLSRANLSKANLGEANLIEAKLCSTILIEANLNKAKLIRTDLRGVDLSEANLSEVIGISNEGLEKEAKSLKDATMPDGTKHD